MLIYDVLKKDHDVVKQLLDKLVHSADASDQVRDDLIGRIRDELVPHARAEEAVFYNSLRTIDEAKDIVRHGYVEHMEAETLLRTLQAMNAVDANWMQVARKLKDAIEHHIAEEEDKIFNAAKQLLVPEEARMMGEAFERIKPEVREETLLQTTLDMIANLMPDRFATPLRSFTYRV